MHYDAFFVYLCSTMNEEEILHIAVVGTSGSGKSAFCDHARELTSKPVRGYRLEWKEFSDPEQLILGHTEIVVQIVNAADLETSLLLTPRLIDMHQKLVLAFNQYRQLTETGHTLDFHTLSSQVGAQSIPIDAREGTGVMEVVDAVIAAHEGKAGTYRHIHIAYGADIEKSIEQINASEHRIQGTNLSKRYVAIRLLEGGKPQGVDPSPELVGMAGRLRGRLEKELGHPLAETVEQARIGFVQGVLASALQHAPDDDRHDHTSTNKIDAILTHKILGLPILVAVLYLVFQCTFALGSYPQEWIQAGVDWLAAFASSHMPEAWYTSLLTDGIIQGVGAVLAFLPNIIILFFFISLMEDTGYMHRLAFLMDRLMHRVGLHGRSFVPMLVGFGCNVPAIMAARSIPDRKERTLTMLMIPFMSCSARLPVYLLFVSAFFQDHKALVMISLYLVGMLLSILFALIMKRTKYFRQEDYDYVSELPPFHRPAWRNTAHHIWERCADYLKKISTVILWASIIIWALYYFPRNEELTAPYATQVAALQQQIDQTTDAGELVDLNAQLSTLDFEMDAVQKEHSALAAIGHWLEPVMRPLGFDWRMNVCILTGLPAKEAIVSTMGILYHQENDTKLAEALADNPFFTPVKAYAFLIFVLLYFPCVATIATLWREAGRKWAIFTVVNSLLLAWLMAFLVFQLGTII